MGFVIPVRLGAVPVESYGADRAGPQGALTLTILIGGRHPEHRAAPSYAANRVIGAPLLLLAVKILHGFSARSANRQRTAFPLVELPPSPQARAI